MERQCINHKAPQRCKAGPFPNSDEASFITQWILMKHEQEADTSLSNKNINSKLVNGPKKKL